MKPTKFTFEFDHTQTVPDGTNASYINEMRRQIYFILSVLNRVESSLNNKPLNLEDWQILIEMMGDYDVHDEGLSGDLMKLFDAILALKANIFYGCTKAAREERDGIKGGDKYGH